MMSRQQPSNDVTVIIGGNAWGGWQDVRITRGCERIPSSFDIGATERYPGQVAKVAIDPGSPCQVMIGTDRVITGYIDRVLPALSGENHVVRLQGRSKVEDLVDCSITNDDVAGLQMPLTDLLSVAVKVSKPFGITARSTTGDNIPVQIDGVPTPQFIGVTLGETPYDLIERLARYLQILVYDDTDGNLVLAKVGAEGSMASGFAQGVNVQRASGALSMDQRYSKYIPSILTYQVLQFKGMGEVQFPPVVDKGVPRYRPLYVVSEQISADHPLAVDRASWEMSRRYGRSQAVRVTCDSWRDSAGKLWQPNAYANVNIPALKLTPTAPWIISEVTFARDEHEGTTAELELMPPQAFAQEPIILNPFGWYQDPNSAPTSGGPA